MINNNKKHILVISQFFYPEPFRINDICKQWVERGYKVSVITGIPNYPEGKFYDGYGFNKKIDEEYNGFSIHRIPLIPRGNNIIGLILNYLSFVFFGFFWVHKTKIVPDYIFMFETSPMSQCLLGVWLKKRLKKKGFNIPLYGYIQDLWPENVEIITGIKSSLIIKPIEKMVEYIYNNCDLLLATSYSFVEAIKERCKDKSKVIYWPQYAEDFYVPINQNIAYDRFPELNIEDFKICFTGNIGKAQGLDILPKVAKELKDEKIKFVIVGNGRDKNNFVDSISKNDVKDKFILIDRQNAEVIPYILGCCDAGFISFMNNELFSKTIPAKLQSYLACGMPIIASAIGETKKIIEEANCGLCSDIGDIEGLKNIILKMKDENLTIYKNNARKYYLSNFVKDKLIDEIDCYFK